MTSPATVDTVEVPDQPFSPSNTVTDLEKLGEKTNTSPASSTYALPKQEASHESVAGTLSEPKSTNALASLGPVRKNVLLFCFVSHKLQVIFLLMPVPRNVHRRGGSQCDLSHD